MTGGACGWTLNKYGLLQLILLWSHPSLLRENFEASLHAYEITKLWSWRGFLCLAALAHQRSRLTSHCWAFRAAKHFALHGTGFTQSEAKMCTPREASQGQMPDNLEGTQEKAITRMTQGERFQELNAQNFSRDCKKKEQNCLPIWKWDTTKEMGSFEGWYGWESKNKHF